VDIQPIERLEMSAYNDEIYRVAESYKGVHMPYGTASGQLDDIGFLVLVIRQATQRKLPACAPNVLPRSGHFRSVDRPERGDIVCWQSSPHGHVGVVLDTNLHQFIGAQHVHGVAVDHYNSAAWRRYGGGPLFLRFIG
jgi:hypothetical protein